MQVSLTVDELAQCDALPPRANVPSCLYVPLLLVRRRSASLEHPRGRGRPLGRSYLRRGASPVDSHALAHMISAVADLEAYEAFAPSASYDSHLVNELVRTFLPLPAGVPRARHLAVTSQPHAALSDMFGNVQLEPTLTGSGHAGATATRT